MIFFAWSLQDVKLFEVLVCNSLESHTVVAFRLSSYCYARFRGIKVVGLWTVPFFSSLSGRRSRVSNYEIDTKFYSRFSLNESYYKKAYGQYLDALDKQFRGYEGIVFLTGTSRLSEQAVREYFSGNKIVYWEAGMKGTIYMSITGVNADADFRDFGAGEYSILARKFSEECYFDVDQKLPLNFFRATLCRSIDLVYLLFLKYCLGNKEFEEFLTIGDVLKSKDQEVNNRVSDSDFILFIDQVEFDTNSTHFGRKPKDITNDIKRLLHGATEVESLRLIRRPHPRQRYTVISESLQQEFPAIYSDDFESSLHDTLDKAHLVVTVNSTAGMEALMLGIPVVTLGRSYFDNLYGVLSVEEGIRFVGDSLVVDPERIQREAKAFLLNNFIPIDYRGGNFYPVHGIDQFLSEVNQIQI